MRAALALSVALMACTPGTVAPSGAGLTLDGEGLQPAGTALRVDFGRAEAGVIAAVTRLLGARPVEVVAQAECGAGPVKAARWANGLTLNFQRDTFLGWVAQEGRGAAPATASGLAPGVARSTVEAQGARFSETSLGTEFTSGGVFGLLDGGEVGTIWAGVTCFFR